MTGSTGDESTGPTAETDAVLSEQIAYYRARAFEYDDWSERRGVFDLGPDFNASWVAEIDEVRRSLSDFDPSGSVLEIAAGTGNWTVELARYAASITALDAASETLEVNARKLAGSSVPVEYVTGDIFQWVPERRYDVAFFSFWISHVPEDRFEKFWDVVDASLVPGGRFFFLDSAEPQRDRYPLAPGLDRSGDVLQGPRNTTDLGTGTSVRKVGDGRRFSVVKRHWLPADLQGQLAGLAWESSVAETDWAFVYGHGRRAPSGAK